MRGQTSAENNIPLPGRRRVWQRWGILVPALLLLTAGFFLGQAAGANTTALPGSEGDPLVTASWVEAKLASFSQGREVGGVEGELSGESSPASVYELVVLQPGTKLLTGTGTEFILRSGKARAIAAAGGGISDLTSGQDLGNLELIARNHLLLSSKDDGRGALMETESIFLIRGVYNTVQ